jgi:beta-1,2-mannobiose phosphorylase / 1,2-beta-oligomannan phosphorylase
MNVTLFINILALLFSFFVVGALLGALFSKPMRDKLAPFLRFESLQKVLLKKSPLNPILKPGTTPWTAESVMNPAALVLGGRTHLVYRAIGMDGVSRLGYASSPDGIVFDNRLPYPVFVAQKPRNLPGHARRYAPVLYPSGGSWGGCEDPRMVCIEGRVYVTFNMFDGWDFIRVAAISIAEEDFLSGQFWEWDGPHLLSPPRQIQKNWVLFPEKVNGKYAILHSIAPTVDVAYRDSIEDIGTTEPFIQSWVGPRGNLPTRQNTWDSHVRGAGPPPIKTDRGWLLLYHAIDDREPSRYKLGAMLLDLTDPTKVLHRSIAPVLSPDESYENEGKPGIVYACGACVRNGTLFVYYGGADKVVCVAMAPLDVFVDTLIQGNPPELVTVSPAQTK